MLKQRPSSFIRYFSISRQVLNSNSSSNSPKITTYVNETTNKETIKIEPIERKNESLESKRARLTYQSRKRGILETDLLLSRFAKKYLHEFSVDELNEYDKLLDHLDWDIYYWATKNYKITPLPEELKESKILKLLQEFSENKEKEILRMPSLHDDK